VSKAKPADGRNVVHKKNPPPRFSFHIPPNPPYINETSTPSLRVRVTVRVRVSVRGQGQGQGRGQGQGPSPHHQLEVRSCIRRLLSLISLSSERDAKGRKKEERETGNRVERIKGKDVCVGGGGEREGGGRNGE
jgi:hypothetical protein